MPTPLFIFIDIYSFSKPSAILHFAFHLSQAISFIIFLTLNFPSDIKFLKDELYKRR